MSENLKYSLFLFFFAAFLSAASALYFKSIQTCIQSRPATENPIAGDQPVSLTVEDISHEECISQASMPAIKPDERSRDKFLFMIACVPEKPVFPFRRPPKIS
jgi:hypothetical protein